MTEQEKFLHLDHWSKFVPMGIRERVYSQIHHISSNIITIFLSVAKNTPYFHEEEDRNCYAIGLSYSTMNDERETQKYALFLGQHDGYVFLKNKHDRCDYNILTKHYLSLFSTREQLLIVGYASLHFPNAEIHP